MAGSTRPLRATLGATALATGLLLTMPSPAMASDMQNSRGSCSSGPFAANYSVTYAPNTDGSDHVVYSVQWDITGPTGPRNNVEARVKEDNNLGHDKIFYTYISEDDVEAGQNQVDLRSYAIEVPASMRMYVEFKFAFDVKDDDDRHCTGHTRNV
jgi:hypothetical protein